MPPSRSAALPFTRRVTVTEAEAFFMGVTLHVNYNDDPTAPQLLALATAILWPVYVCSER